jgi:probable rRNA maturation factor
MAIVIDLQNETGYADIPAAAEFGRWVTAALRESHAQLEQTIRVVDEPQGRELNLRFRGKDSATNVLAFTADDELLEYDCLGDLVLCAPLVAREAVQQGKQAAAHWAHLVVHGMLHLQGYDHQGESQAAEMEALEIEILDTLGYTNPYNE